MLPPECHRLTRIVRDPVAIKPAGCGQSSPQPEIAVLAQSVLHRRVKARQKDYVRTTPGQTDPIGQRVSGPLPSAENGSRDNGLAGSTRRSSHTIS